MDDGLRAQLLARRDEDQRVRHRLPRPPRRGPVRVPDDVAEQWRRVDEDNTLWLTDVVARRGWPGRSMVGDDGAQAAWLLAQHADRRPDLQRALLDALRTAVDDGEAPAAHLAYLEDRVRVNAGRPRIYGTQFEEAGEGFGPAPIEEPDGLDERRAAVGLEPFAEYEAHMRGPHS